MKKFFSEIKNIIKPYGEISDENLQFVLSNFRIETIKKGDFFSKQGDERKLVGLQLSGLTRYYIITEKGIEKTTDFCKKGDIIATFEDDNPSEKWVEALTDTTVAIIESEKFESIIEKDSEWQLIVRKMTEACLNGKSRREIELLSLEGAEKYNLFIENFAQIISDIPQYHIASYLGISPVSLSRIRANR